MSFLPYFKRTFIRGYLYDKYVDLSLGVIDKYVDLSVGVFRSFYFINILSGVLFPNVFRVFSFVVT